MKKILIFVGVCLGILVFLGALGSEKDGGTSKSTSFYNGDGSDASLIRYSSEKTLREKCSTLADVQKNEFACNQAHYFLKR